MTVKRTQVEVDQISIFRNTHKITCVGKLRVQEGNVHVINSIFGDNKRVSYVGKIYERKNG